MNSLWNEIEGNKYPALSENTKCDVVIIGGGIAGITLAYALKDQGMKVIVLEAKRLGNGVTGRTTAHITSQHDLVYYRYLKTFGLEKTKKILWANERAINDIERIIEKESIDCDFRKISSFVFAKSDKGSKKIIKEYLTLNKMGYPAVIHHNGSIIGCKYITALEYKNQATFHPLKYIYGLATAFSNSNGMIYEETAVRHIKGNIVFTEKHRIEAQKIVVATHNPIINFPGLYFIKNHLDKSYVLSYPVDYELEGLYNEIDGSKLTFRMHEGTLICSGQSHVVGRAMKGHYCRLLNDVKLYDLKAKIVNKWSAADGITLDNLPYIGRYGRKSENLFVITGFGKWGMTNSLVAARIISSLILDKKDELIAIYDPHRKMTMRSFFNIIASNAIMFLQFGYWLLKPQNPTCPHLKGKLLYNKEDQTYECPCHGSQFNNEGIVVDTPAIHKIVKKKK